MQIAGTSLDPLLVWKPNHSLQDAFDFASSTAASLARLGSGANVAHVGRRPERRLELYEKEGCPYSRMVREALSILDLDATIHPCPSGGTRFRAKLEGLVGRFTIPVLVDANADLTIADSDVIVRHLFSAYGDGKIPLALRARRFTMLTSDLASKIRGDRGSKAEASREPEQLLELYSYEACPYCRLVREALSRLEIPYVLHNVARGSAKREAFVALAGKMQVPFLVDPAMGDWQGKGMFESKAIIAYLEARYGAAATRAAA
jgi:glutathione S-transferase